LNTNAAASGEFEYFDCQPAREDARAELLRALRATPKSVPAKYFYDQRGSELFEVITRLPEYYLTRTEMGLFERHATEIAEVVGRDCALVEYGSGSSAKVRRLLETARPTAYVPVDISREHLEQTARELHLDFPWLNVYPTCADITTEFELPAPVQELDKVGFFPGSSIGNFDPEIAAAFLKNVAATLGRGSHLILGVDRKKDASILEAAYNDTAGVTAAFNLNLLNNLSSLLQAEFAPENFDHYAHYDAAKGCIAMFLEATVEHEVVVGEERIHFDAGERLHTENSYKYDPDELEEVARAGSYEPVDMWTDAQQLFSVFVLRAQ
jgi:dimethylhistidine N-methyltransferase